MVALHSIRLGTQLLRLVKLLIANEFHQLRPLLLADAFFGAQPASAVFYRVFRMPFLTSGHLIPPIRFDATLGFPGEGPQWSIAAANVGSWLANTDLAHWSQAAVALQEVRLSNY